MNQPQFSQLLIRYVIGFAAALCLSVLSYLIVTKGIFASAVATMAVLLLLATIQLVVQLVCFLHLGVHGRSRSRTMTLGFTMLMMLVIVIGSLWIMRNLEYRMGMSGEAMSDYMQSQNKKGF
jgi:cytochrome o ubiquinol oxidase operon protein cyoD